MRMAHFDTCPFQKALLLKQILLLKEQLSELAVIANEALGRFLTITGKVEAAEPPPLNVTLTLTVKFPAIL